MKQKYVNIILGLMGLGIVLLWIYVFPLFLTSLPIWVVGLIGFIFILLWAFVCFSSVANHFGDIYKEKGFKGIRDEIIFWLPPLYFLGCLVLFFYGGGAGRSPIFSYLGIAGFASGFIYGFIADRKNLRNK